MTMMQIQTASLARSVLKQQVEIFGGDQVSLDSLWRAWSSPAGHEPKTWAELAAPLVSGFAAYFNKLGLEHAPRAEAQTVLWIWEDESKDPWRSGDVMSHELIAWAYATYLDTELARPAKRSGLARGSLMFA
jgi:hypothetical protein